MNLGPQHKRNVHREASLSLKTNEVLPWDPNLATECHVQKPVTAGQIVVSSWEVLARIVRFREVGGTFLRAGEREKWGASV